MRYDLGLSGFFAWCKLTELGSIFFKYGICLNDLYILLYGLKVTFSVLREENMIHPNLLTWTEDLSQVSAVVTWWSSLSFLLEHLTVDGVKDTSLSTAYHGWSSSPSLHQSDQSFLQGPGYFFGTGTGKGACISPTSICPWSTWQLSSLAFSQLPLKCWKCCTICIY